MPSPRVGRSVRPSRIVAYLAGRWLDSPPARPTAIRCPAARHRAPVTRSPRPARPPPTDGRTDGRCQLAALLPRCLHVSQDRQWSVGRPAISQYSCAPAPAPAAAAARSTWYIPVHAARSRRRRRGARENDRPPGQRCVPRLRHVTETIRGWRR